MQTWTLPLSPDLPVELAGRKAAALGRLAGAGFPVPPGVCIPTGAFRAAVEAASPPADLRLPDGLLDELARSLPMDAPLAVRTSAVREDLPDASLAGRYATILNVAGPAALEQAVLDCWRSYRCALDPEACGADPAGADPRALQASPDGVDGCAVLVQPLLESECAGVCFSVDPVRQHADLLLVVAGWGQGAGVVSGAVPTDTARLRRMDLSAAEQSIADKHTALRPAPPGGVAPVPVPLDLRAIPCLPPGWLERVDQYGLALEQFFFSLFNCSRYWFSW